MSFTVVSTFAGCGGSSLGYKLAGGTVRLAVEWDDNAVETYRLNHAGTPIYHGDIAKLSSEKALELSGLKPGELDVFDGSPPCQGFSTAGKRDFNDDRNQLFREYVRLLKAFQPKVFVMENVSGMVKGKMKLIFAEILRELKACGYRVKARLLNAKYFNVPQSRERMIFIGVRDDLGIDPSHPGAQTKPKTVQEALKGVPRSAVRAISQRASGIWEKLTPGQNGSAVSGKNKDFSLHKINPNQPCPTIRKGQTAGNGLMHWAESRYLSTLELSRLGSFPDGYQWSGTAEDAMQRIGNSVPPNLMKAIAEHICDNILSKSG
jgi:DNA (cytosine-5)-methyltransferase 1